VDGPAPDALGWWLPLGQQHDRTAWFNLAATGIGLTGPGATDITRTLLVRLLDHTTAATVVTPAATLTELLDLPDNPSPDLADHLARHLAGDLLTPTTSPQPAHRLHLTPTPFTALEAVEDELHRRLADPDSVTAPWLLLVPAPTTETARHRLQAVLADGRAHHLHAVVLGPWPVGWSCHIDDQLRITQHTPPALATPPHTHPALLTGAHLAPTTSAELRQHLGVFSDDAGFPALHPEVPGTDVSASAAPTAHRSPRDENSGPEPAGRDAGSRASDGTDQGSGGRTDNGPAPVTPFHLSVLGPTALTYRAAPTPADPEPPARPINQLGPRATELLIYLAAHPGGVHRATLVATLWPDAHPERPTNALHATLGRIRRTLHDLTAQSATTTPGGPSNGAGTDTVLHDETDRSSTQTDPTDLDLTALMQHDGDRYRLHPELVTVDYWAFLIACTHLTDPDTTTRAHHCNTAITAYRGPLGTDLASEWLISLREHTRRRYFDALDTLARITIHADPERTLDLLETARNLEPLKEGIYRDLMRIQSQLGRHDAAQRTYELLETQLADIDEQPESLTHALLHAIRAQQGRVDDALRRSDPQ
jgi:DNA-binding SARP family transcriptional activator